MAGTSSCVGTASLIPVNCHRQRPHVTGAYGERLTQPKAAPPIYPTSTTTPNTNVMTMYENIRAKEVTVKVLDIGKI